MKINNQYRPKLHYTAEKGWINDPNGFSMYNGEFHLFAQHNPHDSVWGPMHWSHASSKDLITWNHLPIALTPDREYELEGGCFSGSAIEHDGKHYLFYTGASGTLGEPLAQRQCMAIGDGVTYTKIENNPIIKEEHLPDFAFIQEFRDPKVFKKNDIFYCVIGAMVRDINVGTVLLYKSIDLYSWTYVGEVLRAPSDKSQGIVFECPDLVEVDNKYVLLTSPINMPSINEKFNNLSSAAYYVGEMNFETGRLEVEYFDEIDSGFDFYAPQSTINEKGEVIMIAWAQMWERNYITHLLKHGWCGAMSMPRVLSLKDNKLIQTPIKSLDNYHKAKYSDINEGNNRYYRLLLDIDTDTGTNFKLEILKHVGLAFIINYNVETNTLIINRDKTAFKLDKHPLEDGVNNERSLKLLKNNKLKLDIIVDNSLIEIFVNNGEHTLTSNYYVIDEKLDNNIETDMNYILEKIDL